MGKRTARGLEHRLYERDLKKYGKGGVANVQRPVGEKNPNTKKYLKAADAELKKSKVKNYTCK